MRRSPPHAEQPTTKQAFVYIPLYFSPAICFDGPFLKHEGFEPRKYFTTATVGTFDFSRVLLLLPTLTNRIYVKQSFPTPKHWSRIVFAYNNDKKAVHVNVLLRKVAVFAQKYFASSVKNVRFKTDVTLYRFLALCIAVEKLSVNNRARMLNSCRKAKRSNKEQPQWLQGTYNWIHRTQIPADPLTDNHLWIGLTKACRCKNIMSDRPSRLNLEPAWTYPEITWNDEASPEIYILKVTAIESGITVSPPRWMLKQLLQTIVETNHKILSRSSDSK